MKTVHVIFNAHIDPVWLWPWQSAVDAAIATCRSACDRLDDFPDLRFTKGEAWTYREIERLDPALFKRICRHVEAGRWELIGGWWIQPDCNFPGGIGIRKQIELGQAYFRKTFGTVPRIGYNVDSFGHAAALPRIMREFGQDRYIMMRPQQHEHPLASRLFHWRGEKKDPSVLTFRISQSYCLGWLNDGNVQAALSRIPEGIDHTMLFAGLGDHGGGPAEYLVKWCLEHPEPCPGVRLEFSTVSRYFDIVERQTKIIPEVTGELQMHAVGCYSVHRPLKVAVRDAERALTQAEMAGKVAQTFLSVSKNPLSQTGMSVLPSSLETAWENVCFNHFHDTLGGTCIPSAFPVLEGQLHGAIAAADTIMHHALRRCYPALKPCKDQRLMLMNASPQPFDGFVEVEPWRDWRSDTFDLVDEKGKSIPWQRMQHEAGFVASPRILFRLKMKRAALRELRLVERAPVAVTGTARATATGIGTTGISCDGTRADFGAAGTIAPILDITEDGTDTWSHGVDRYPEGPVVASAQWHAPCAPDTGPLMAALLSEGTLGGGTVHSEWRLYDRAPYADLTLRIHWSERRKLLKLRIPFPTEAVAERCDGTMDGTTPRPNDGREVPVQQCTLIPLKDGTKLGIVMPDVFAMDATRDRLRLTLLRSPVMANHEPHRAHTPREIYADHGVHAFRFRFFLSRTLTLPLLFQHAAMMNAPVLTGDVTYGMTK
ncbi:MAG: hypothetical protein FWF84_01945 [Kiritimatiellaeota bacterium]|nr:hypothetical protein [Kiritimatiellota bacterium]